jgi:hypothetical protein
VSSTTLFLEQQMFLQHVASVFCALNRVFICKFHHTVEV